MIEKIFAAGLLAVVILPASAHAQTAYCSAPTGYSGTHCFNNVCEYATDLLYRGYIGPSLEVSRSGLNCTPLSRWPYYTLTSSQVSHSHGADAPSPAPEISADDALEGLTLMAGLVLVGRGRRLTQ